VLNPETFIPCKTPGCVKKGVYTITYAAFPI